MAKSVIRERKRRYLLVKVRHTVAAALLLVEQMIKDDNYADVSVGFAHFRGVRLCFLNSARGNWQSARLHCWMPTSVAGDVCGVPTELLCLRQVYDFVDISCQRHFNTQNVGVPMSQCAEVLLLLIQKCCFHFLLFYNHCCLAPLWTCECARKLDVFHQWSSYLWNQIFLSSYLSFLPSLLLSYCVCGELTNCILL